MKKIVVLAILFITNFAFSQLSINELLAENKIKEAHEIAKSNYEKEPDNLKTFTQHLQLLQLNLVKGDEFLTELEHVKDITKDFNPYYYLFWESAFEYDESGLSKLQIASLKEIIKNKKFDGTLKIKAKILLGNHFFQKNDFKTKDQYYGDLGNIIDWSIVGVFENISASGYNRDYHTLTKYKKDDSFLNKKGNSVSWISMNKESKGSWAQIDNHFNISEGVAFAQTFIHSEKDQDVEIRFGLTGSFKLWVNDAFIAGNKEETRTIEDGYISKIKLKKGVNRVLFQIGVSQFETMNLYARITDSEGIAISDLSFSDFANDYHKNQTANPNKSFNKLGNPFTSKFDKTSLLDIHLQSIVLEKNFQIKELRLILEEASKTYPKSSIVNIGLLKIYNHFEYYSLYSQKIEALKKYDNSGAEAADILFNESMQQKKYDDARIYLDVLKKSHKTNADLIVKEINLDVNSNYTSRAINLINSSYEKYSNYYEIVNWKYEVLTKVDKDPDEALKILKLYLKSNYNSGAYDALAKHYLNNGELDLAIDTYKQLKEQHKDKYGPIETLAKIHALSQKFSEAKNYYDEILRQAPYIGSYYDARGDCQQELGNMEEAKKDYSLALTYSPTLFETREKLRYLNGKVSIKNQFKEVNLLDVTKEQITQEDYPNDNSVILHNEKQVLLYEGGGKEEIYHIAVKVLNTAGIDNWKEYSIGLLNSQTLDLEYAAIVKANGSIIKADVNYNQLVFTGLEANDNIILSYKLKSYYDGSLSEHFWDTQYFKYYLPVKKSIYSIIYHNSFDLKYKMSNMDVSPTERVIDDYTYLSWSRENQDAMDNEPLMPDLVDNSSVLHLTTIPSWEFIVKWYNDLSKTKAESDFEVQNVVTELFKDKKNLSDLDKAKIIYDYIVENIRYSSVPFRQSGWIPQKASKVINTKVGDCKDVSTLFVIMCKEVGIEASLVLVDTKNNGRKKMPLPSVEFNHCIAHADLDGQEYFIELTSDLLPFGAVSGYLKNAEALIISEKNQSKPFKIPENKNNLSTSQRKSKITLRDNNVEVSSVNFNTGGYAAQMRGIYKHLNKEARFKQLATNLKIDLSSVELKSLKFDDNLFSNSDTLDYSYDFIVNSPYTKIGDLKIFRVPIISKITPFEFLSIEKRKFDLELWQYLDVNMLKEQIEFEIPSDKKVVDFPKDFKLESKFGSYELTFKKENAQVTILRVFKLNTDVILQEDYKEFRTFMNEIFEKENINIGLKNK